MLQLWPRGVDVQVAYSNEKSVPHRVQFEAKCQETTRYYARLESVMAITHFQTGGSWHFPSFKDNVLKIEL